MVAKDRNTILSKQKQIRKKTLVKQITQKPKIEYWNSYWPRMAWWKTYIYGTNNNTTDFEIRMQICTHMFWEPFWCSWIPYYIRDTYMHRRLCVAGIRMYVCATFSKDCIHMQFCFLSYNHKYFYFPARSRFFKIFSLELPLLFFFFHLLEFPLIYSIKVT